MRLSLVLGISMLAAAAMAQPTPPPAPVPPPAPRTHAAAVVMSDHASFLGVGVADVDSERAKALKLKEERGAEVTHIEANSPAAKAGIKESDVILEYNGTAVEGTAQLHRLVRETPAGRQVKIDVWREGAPVTVMATVEARKGMTIELPSRDWSFDMPPMPQMDLPHMMMTTHSGMLGIEGESLGEEPQFAEFFGVKDGVLVKAVTRNSVAEKAGIKAGDVITKLGDTHVASTHDITSALRGYRSQANFTVTVVRNKKEMSLTASFNDQSGSTGSPAEHF